MHAPASREDNADRFAKIVYVAKLRHATCERKLVHDTLASFREVCDLARNPDTSFVEHDAAYASDGPIGSQVSQLTTFCLVRMGRSRLAHIEHFHAQDSSQKQIIHASPSVPHGECEKSNVSGSECCGLITRTKFDQLVFSLNGQPVFLCTTARLMRAS